ncbi:MAG: YihY/virulence factor BrkB family protein [Actinomycetota bacterium]|nr:YihY/virulence factor BrkB family protein [Actinomycetota bacterium]
MRSIVEFGQEWYEDASDQLRRADPLIMGAAFAYNALFALVPLAIAFVSLLTLFEAAHRILDDLVEMMSDVLPPDIAPFLIRIVGDSVTAVEDNRAAIIFVTVPIALWSGSRAVYTVQKALRLVEESDLDVGYLRMRVTGILVTIGAGFAVIAAYFLVVVGRILSHAIANEFGRQGQEVAQIVVVVVASFWVFALLYVIYRWGAPRPVPWTAITSALVTAVLAIGTWAIFSVAASARAPASIAVFGAVGLILIWLYAVGMVVVGAPIAFGSLMRVLKSESRR